MGRAACARKGIRLAVVGAVSERRVDALEQLGGALISGSHHDAIRMQEVNDGRAFAQELGIGNDIEPGGVHAMAVKDTANPLVGVDRHRALFDDHLVAGDGARNLRDHRFNVRQVSRAGVSLRCADRDEDGFATLNGCAQIGCEVDSAAQVFGEQIGQMVFVDRNSAVSQRSHLGFIVVDAGDLMADLGKAYGGDEPNVTRSDNANGD